MVLTRLLVLSVALLAGCATVEPPVRVWEALGPPEALPQLEIPEIPRAPRPTALQRVLCDQPTPCYTGPIDEPEIRAWSLPDTATALTALRMGQDARQGLVDSQRAVSALEREIAALYRLGRLTEAQAAVLTEEARHYQRQYQWEWITARLALVLLLVR